jgi:aspartate aminotransferase-like enzyme
VEILVGSGTLANDAVAVQIAALGEPGIVLTNGEFGDRLVDHAHRFDLSFEAVRLPWGTPFDYDLVADRLARAPGLDWIWFVHCETATGMLNDLDTMVTLAQERNVRVCVDCVSSLGTVPVDLRHVFLASGCSGKGLGAPPGLALVFYNHTLEPSSRALPRYLDLGYYARSEGVPFTSSSNLVAALQTALERMDAEAHFRELRAISTWLHRELAARGIQILVSEPECSPAVVTLVLPKYIDGQQLGKQLEAEGCWISYNSHYLVERNWIQMCLFGEFSREAISSVLDRLCSQSAQVMTLPSVH